MCGLVVSGGGEWDFGSWATDGGHEHVLCVSVDGDLVLEVVVDELGDAVKCSAVEAVFDRDPVATVDDFVTLNEGVV